MTNAKSVSFNSTALFGFRKVESRTDDLYSVKCNSGNSETSQVFEFENYKEAKEKFMEAQKEKLASGEWYEIRLEHIEREWIGDAGDGSYFDNYDHAELIAVA